MKLLHVPFRLLLLSCLTCFVTGGFNIPAKPHYFKQQLVDHFDPSGSENFYSQRYYLNKTFFKGPGGGSTIIVIVGGEGAIEPSSGIYYPFVTDILAKRFSSLVVEPEHRFYGESLPMGESSTYNDFNKVARLLNPQQALEDLMRFIRFVQRKNGCEESPSNPNYCPVITVGGSYPGWLSAMARLRYPNVVDMAYAASAPMKFYSQEVDQYEYYKRITSSAERSVRGCANGVRNVMRKMMEQKRVYEVVNKLDLCTPLPMYIVKGGLDVLLEELNMVVMYSFANLNMANYPPESETGLRKACKLFANGSTNELKTLMVFLKLFAQKSDLATCFDLSKQMPAGGGDWSGDGTGRNGLMWDFQTSTFLVERIGTNNITDMFPPRRWSLEWLENHSAFRFNAKPQPFNLATLWGFSESSLVRTGASKIVFTNGLNDGWSVGGITKNLSSTLVVYNLPNGAHHSDLSHRMSNRTSDVIQVHESIQVLLEKWIHDVGSETTPRGNCGYITVFGTPDVFIAFFLTFLLIMKYLWRFYNKSVDIESTKCLPHQKKLTLS